MLAALVALLAGVVGAPSLERTPTPVQQRALEEHDALQRQDHDAAKRSTMLRTPAEIVQRFGFPDDVGGANGNGVYWNYRHLGLDGQPDGGILFVFIDGRVAWQKISIPDR